ncbi:MAG: hypothetical protein R2780_05270 [Crocinitomicaceae bacterium]
MKSEHEKLADGVRYYFFLGDSTEVDVEVTDTIFISELDEMLGTIDENLNLIQMDIDTLGSIIDSTAYQNLEYEKHLYPESIDYKMAPKRLELATYRLKMAELQAKKLEFKLSKRLMLNLRRSQFNEIAGYQIKTSYFHNGEKLEFTLLTDADFRIID